MRNTFFILTISILTLSACRTKREVAQVWDYIQERPDSALATLNVMDASTFHGQTLAEYRLLKAMALDKNYVNVASDSLAMPAYQFFRKHGPKEKEMMSLYYLGVAHFYSHDDPSAVLLFETVTDLAGQVGNLYYTGLSHIMKSYSFSRTYCISEAVRSAEMGVQAFEAIPNPFQVQRAKLRLADAYHSTKEFEKAFDICQELIRTCQTDTFTMRHALLHAGYSLYLAHPEKADSAIRFYERAVNEYGAQMDAVEAAHFGEVSCMAGDTEQAHLIVEQLKALGTYPEQRSFLEYRLYKKENKLREALVSAEEFHNQLDSIWVTALEQSLVKTQRNYQAQQRLLAEHSLFLTRLLGAVSILCLLLVLLLFAMRHRQAVAEREQLISSVGETAKLLQEAEQKNVDMEQSLVVTQKRYISAYKRQFSKISSIIANYYISSKDKNGRDIVYKQVMDIAATISCDQTRMSMLERDVNIALDNAMKWYREEFPNKTMSHYNMVCLIMAGFSIPMIEILTSTPKNTLYSKKSRLLDEIRNSNVAHRDLLMLTIK